MKLWIKRKVSHATTTFSSLVEYCAGNGSNDHGGKPATVGHLFGFGSTYERATRAVHGVRERGKRAQGPLNHWTGKGWVKEHKGDYYDAIHVKHLLVVLMLVETFGGIAPCLCQALGAFARRAHGVNKVDRTKYGNARRSYYPHWCQRLANAAARSAMQAVVDQTTKLKAKVNGAAQAATLGAAA